MGGKSFRRHSRVVWPGFTYAPTPRHVSKVGRNDPCPCGAGKKYKDCHESEGSVWLEKLARDREREHLKEVRAQLKEKGVPWYKRLFYRV